MGYTLSIRRVSRRAQRAIRMCSNGVLGTTGKPKGVEVMHRNVTNRKRNQCFGSSKQELN